MYKKNGEIKSIVNEFGLYVKYTFGDKFYYMGTTTDFDTSIDQVRDIDILVVFTELNESHLNYIWKIVDKIHEKYNILLDVRIFLKKNLSKIPIINKHLLKIFLNDWFGENPFKNFSASEDELLNSCKKRIKKQKDEIIKIMPRITAEAIQLKKVGQCVYDAMRAFLVAVNNPIASKDDACNHFEKNYPKFDEATYIYKGLLDPSSIIDVKKYFLDSLAVVKHLQYIIDEKPLEDKVLLINTPSSILPHPKDDYLHYDHNMPLGLICLATYLDNENIDVEILDAYAENLGAFSVIDRIFKMEKIPRIIGFNTSSPNIHVIHQTASYIKRIRSDIIIVCGGPHATLAPEHTLKYGNVDFLIKGEGEIPFKKLVTQIFNDHNVKSNNIPGVFYMNSGTISGKNNKELLDLSKILTPAFSFLPYKRYFQIKKRVYLHTSRGCGFKCIYCSVHKFWNGRVREIPMDILMNHVRDTVKKYKPKEIQIVDDNFSHKNGKLIRDFSKEILKLELNFKWKCQARADQLSEDTIKLMAKSGCFEVDLGIESGNSKIQKYIRKNLNLEKTKDVVTLLSGNSIYSKAFFMLGFPNEDYSQILDTINYSIELKNKGLNDVAFFPVMPFPGTEISKITKKETYQGAIIDPMFIHERSFAMDRLKKYSAKPELSLNSIFSPEELRFLVKFSYYHFNSEQPVNDLEKEFNQYIKEEEEYIYAI